MPRPEIQLGNVTLPGDLVWVDEFTWTPMEQARSYTLDGGLIVEEAERRAGRPITLQGGEDQAWVTRAVVEWLYALARVPSPAGGLVLVLADARVFHVVFRQAETAIEATPIVPVSPPAPGDWYRVTLRLMTV